MIKWFEAKLPREPVKKVKNSKDFNLEKHNSSPILGGGVNIDNQSWADST